MQLKWLEDFVALAETRSFSEAAQRRNVTQPAFGRRIRALEDWMKVDLVDRDGHRPTLTPAGKLFLDLAAEIVRRLEDTRKLLHEEGRRPASTLTVAASHTLGVTYYPRFIDELEASDIGITSSLAAINSHEGLLRLVDGGCDLLIAYHHPRISVPLDPQRFPSLTVGHDLMVPLSAPGPDGRPLHVLPGTPDKPARCLTYSPTIFMGRAVADRLQDPPQPHHLHPCYTTDMAHALKGMMLAGRGLGWLPLSLVEAELRAGSLVSAVPSGLGAAAQQAWTAPLQLRLYRSAANRKTVLADLWAWLEARYADTPPTPVPRMPEHARSAPAGAGMAFAGPRDGS